MVELAIVDRFIGMSRKDLLAECRLLTQEVESQVSKEQKLNKELMKKLKDVST